MLKNKFYTELDLKDFGFKSLGENVMIDSSCNIIGEENIEIGNNVRIDAFCNLICSSGFISIGSNVHIASYCYLNGSAGITLCDFSGLSNSINVFTMNDDYSGGSLTNPTVPSEFKNVTSGEVYIGKHSIVGANCTILPKTNIEEVCAFGAYSLIRGKYNKNSIYMGNNPKAKYLKERKINLLEHEKAYLGDNNV